MKHHITSRLLRSLWERTRKPLGARSEAFSFVLRSLSEQAPATTPSERVWAFSPEK